MSAEFPELERGQAAAATKRKHIPTWLYKQAHRLTDEMTEIRTEIENIGTFNAGKQKEKVLKLLMDWYPQINAFESKLKPYDAQLKILRENESAFRFETEQAQWALQKERQEGQSLIYELREYQDFISSIPSELLEELKQRYEMSQQQQNQNFEL
jgi:chromosome segregation ATPase